MCDNKKALKDLHDRITDEYTDFINQKIAAIQATIENTNQDILEIKETLKIISQNILELARIQR